MSKASRSRFAVVALFVMVMAAPAVAQSPPKNLKLVGDHWTAWDPPATVEEGAEVHVIQEGDTLWALAERFYNNPYLWPQLWERNQYILDAHWIYPGDPLVLGIEVESGEALAQGERGAGQEGQEGAGEGAEGPLGSLRQRATENPFVQLGTADDLYCSGYIGDPAEKFPYRIIGSEFDLQNPTTSLGKRGKVESVFGVADSGRVNLSTGDVVYLDGGRSAGMSAGDVFTVVRVSQKIHHPVTHKTVGRLYAYQGRVRVLSVQPDTAIAEVSQSCEPVRVGSVLKPFVPEPVPTERQTPLRPINQPVSQAELRGAPVILHAKRGLISLGQDQVVWVGLGESDNVIPGDIYTIYREGRGHNPPLVLGEVAILSVNRATSLAKIITSRYPVYVGDYLVPK